MSHSTSASCKNTTALSTQYGPWALVTGASSGIGKAFCQHLAAAGFNLVLVARRQPLLAQLADSLKANHGIEIRILAVDLSADDAPAHILQDIEPLDIGLVILNAGFGYKGYLEEQPLDAMDAMLMVNLIAPTRLAHQLLPKLKQRGRGGLIFTGSIEGETPFPHSAAYAASKAYIHNLGLSLYGECQATGVDVLVLSPGSTDTDAPIMQGFQREQLVGLMPPETVAAQALSQLGKRPLWITGWHNRLFIGFLRLLPRKLATLLAGKGLLKTMQDAKNKAH